MLLRTNRIARTLH